MKLFSAFRSLAPFGSRRRDAQSPAKRLQVWELVVGPTVLGQMEFLSYETPWITAFFRPTPDFQRWVPLIEWLKQREAAQDDDDEEQPTPPEVELLLVEKHAAGGLVAIEREDPSEPRRTVFHFNDDFTLVSFR
ncbi:hypothetical protein [Rhizobacter sp. LjRoot28]|uniref:hypothetical protein n=1 Tax=Rhizobacter sp. LjRoot28 TaxID=3342309 RepID=UPI003ED0022E